MGKYRAKEYLPFPLLEQNHVEMAHAGTVMGGCFSQSQEQYPFACNWIHKNLEQKHIKVSKANQERNATSNPIHRFAKVREKENF